jgi:hypothetical protein
MQAALVRWRDAHASHETITREEAVALRAWERVAVGLVLAQTEAGITLVMDSGPDTGDQGDPYLFIPREMIVAVVALVEAEGDE